MFSLLFFLMWLIVNLNNSLSDEVTKGNCNIRILEKVWVILWPVITVLPLQKLKKCWKGHQSSCFRVWMITCGVRTKLSVAVCRPTHTYTCTQYFQNYSLIVFNRWWYVTREMQCLNFELVSIYTHLVRGGLPMVSSFHRNMHLNTSHTGIISCIFYSSDSDPLLYQSPPETIDSGLCFAGFGPSSPPSWDSCWPLVPLPA